MFKDLNFATDILQFALNLLEPSTWKCFLPCLPVAKLAVKKSGGVIVFSL